MKKIVIRNIYLSWFFRYVVPAPDNPETILSRGYGPGLIFNCCVRDVSMCAGGACVCVRLKYSPVAWRPELMFLISFQRFSLPTSIAFFIILHIKTF